MTKSTRSVAKLVTRLAAESALVLVAVWALMHFLAAAGPEARKEPEAAPYPRAHWRLAPRGELDDTLIWFSQIAIRHTYSDASGYPLRPPGWVPEAPSRRSQSEARALAYELREQAAAEPERFAELARRFSEDVVARRHGGSYGGVRATQVPERFLDAFAALETGEVSRVIETAYGFHILMRHAPPEPRRMAARRIVVGYRDTSWLQLQGADPPDRSREEAQQLARRLAEQARSGRASFADLVTAYSDHPDAAIGGDLGSWSSRDAIDLPLRSPVLGPMSPGEVADPIEAPWGFEVLVREAPRAHTPYAAAILRLRFEAHAEAGADNSLARVRKRASALLAEAQDPASGGLEALAEKQCCLETRAWVRGDVPVALRSLLPELEVGALASQPVVWERTVALVRREDPARIAESQKVRLTLPAPDGVDLKRLVRRGAGQQFGAAVKQLVEKALIQISAEPPEAEGAQMVVDTLAQRCEASAPRSKARVEAYEEALDALKDRLGERRAGELLAALRELATAMMLEPSRS